MGDGSIRDYPERVVRQALETVFGVGRVFPIVVPFDKVRSGALRQAYAVVSLSDGGNEYFEDSRAGEGRGNTLQRTRSMVRREQVLFSAVSHRFDLYLVRVCVPYRRAATQVVDEGATGQVDLWDLYADLSQKYRQTVKEFQKRGRFKRSSLPQDAFDSKTAALQRSFLVEVSM